MWAKIRWLICLGAVLAIQTGCSEEATAPPSNTNMVTVIGTVTGIIDDTPVDGDVKVFVELDDGEVETLYLLSFWTRPSEDEQEIYQLIIQLKIGDRVEALGERTKSGVKLTQLKKL